MITYNGISLETFSAHVFRIDTDTAPARVLDPYAIEGRSGDLLMDRKRYQNVVMTYRVVLYGANADSNFRELKNFLLSQIGYKRLTDTEHPDEFYLAYVSGDIVPELTENRDKIKFELEFTRKPQRYLLSGEAETYIGGSHQIEGHVISVDALLIDDSQVEVYIPTSDTSGTPTAPVDIHGYDSIGFSVNGSAEYSSQMALYDSGAPVIGKTVNNAEIDLLTGTGSCYAYTAILPTLIEWNYSGGYFTQFLPTDYTGDKPMKCSHYTPSTGGEDFTIQYDQANQLIKIKDSRFTGFTAKTRFNEWISTQEIKIVNICNYDVTVTAYTPNFPSSGQVTIQTDGDYQWLLLGYYPTGSFNNPTYMKARPLITADVNSATGGSFTINSDTVTIDTGVEKVVIDCEMQDCYYGSTNLNDKVSFAPTYDFPVLNPGENVITQGAGISDLTIKPRWWSI